MDELTSTEVVRALAEAQALGRLTVTGGDPVVITGTDEDRARARGVLMAAGFHCTPYPGQDEWTAR